MSFDQLYGKNCAGCHGVNGKNGVALNLSNPEYQALVDDATLRDVISNGEKGTLMPAFKQEGTLTDAQIDALIREIRRRWQKPNAFGGATPPPFKALHPGDAAKGQQVYTAACASCHGESAQKPGKDGSILEGAFLALINEQTVRTIVIAGRPDIGQPDWRNHIKGHWLSDDEITDVTAWLMAQRSANPVQPYRSRGGTEVQPLANKQP
jgi:cytochrome c oxidase cbb3-type subunit 3/ubiquinol-cytochrome c reductase cytochrome c subunit